MKGYTFFFVLCFALAASGFCMVNVPSDYPTIQAAVDAVNNETISISDGVYTGAGNYNISIVNKTLTIQSVTTAANCIIDCQSNGNAFNIIESSVIIDGLTIQNGHAQRGGGIHFEDSAVSGRISQIENCRITDNTAEGGMDMGQGGGLFCFGGTLRIIDTEIFENNAGGYDGGYGAGIYISGSTVSLLTSNVHHNGTSGDCYRGLYGGGIYLAGTLDAYQSRITDNIACNGGGIYQSGGSAHIGFCRLLYNSAGQAGSAIWTYHSFIRLLNDIIIGNVPAFDPTGFALAIASDNTDLSIDNCTLTDNTEGSFRLDNSDGYPDYIFVRNSILRDGAHSILLGPFTSDLLSVSYSNIEGGFEGEGNINADPKFTSGPGGNYFLSQINSGQAVNSPCFDTGSTLAKYMKYELTNDAISFSMDELTTRTDQLSDSGRVDMGFHYENSNPNPSECETNGVTLYLSQTLYYPANLFSCKAYVCNAGTSSLSGYPLFVILEMYGQFYFAPHFNSYDNYLDLYPQFYQGLTEITVIPDFTWPEGLGYYEGARIYGAITDPAITQIAGQWQVITFGWAE